MVFAIVLFLVDVIERRRRGETFSFGAARKALFLGLCLFCALTLLPSALLSPDVSFSSLGNISQFHSGPQFVLPMLLFLDVDEKAIKRRFSVSLLLLPLMDSVLLVNGSLRELTVPMALGGWVAASC